MNNTNLTDYVEKYLDGKLKDGDLWEFKHKFEENQELANELRFQQELRETLKDSNKMKLRTTLHNSYVKTSSTNLFSQKWKLQAIAAAVVIMMLVGGGLLFNKMQTSSSSHMALYEEYMQVDQDLFTVRAGNTTTNSNSITNGLAAFKNSDYLTAVSLFSLNDDNMAAKLYAGFSYMKLSDFDNAESKFKEIITDNNNLFIDQAEFNLALCYVATNEMTNAKQVLTTIITENSAYSTKAQELLREVNRH